jgi:hypothetical protein
LGHGSDWTMLRSILADLQQVVCQLITAGMISGAEGRCLR